MLRWALLFLVIALISALFGFTDVAGTSMVAAFCAAFYIEIAAWKLQPFHAGRVTPRCSATSFRQRDATRLGALVAESRRHDLWPY